MCLDSEMHTCAEVKFIQKLRVGGLLHSNHLILTNNAELSNKKIDYKENCFHARDSIDERIILQNILVKLLQQIKVSVVFDEEVRSNSAP